MKKGVVMVVGGAILAFFGGLFFGLFSWSLIIVGVILTVFGGIKLVRS